MLGEENRAGSHARRGERAPLPPPLSGAGTFPPGAPLRSAGGTDFRGRNPRTATGMSDIVGSPRTEGPTGGKVPATAAKRRSEVRGLVKRHRRHVRPVVANGVWVACSERRTALGHMLGEGNEPPFPPPSGDGSHPPGRSLRSLGGPTPSSQPPQNQTLRFVPLGGPTSVSQPPQNPRNRVARRGTDFRGRNPRTATGMSDIVGSPRTEGPTGGKVPATAAKRRSEVRGLVKRHRRHVRPVVANGGLGCMLGEENRVGSHARRENRVRSHARRGERAPLPTAFRRWVPSPRTFAALTGGTDLRLATPTEPDAPLRSAGGTDLRLATPAKPAQSRRSPGDRLPWSQPSN